MKHLIWIIPLALLMLLLVACATPTPPSPVEIEMTKMAAQAQACATLGALGTPYPCNPPTATLQPTSTPTPLPTPTATPFTGWRQYTEDGEYVRDMPPGWVPDCQGLVGCPGKNFQYYENGTPVVSDQSFTGTPGWWPYVLIGVPIALFFIAIMAAGIYAATAPSRVLAKGIHRMMEAQAAAMQQLPAPKQSPQTVPVEVLARWLVDFLKARRRPQLEAYLRKELEQYGVVGQLPINTVVAMLQRFDREHSTTIAPLFGQYLEARLKLESGKE